MEYFIAILFIALFIGFWVRDRLKSRRAAVRPDDDRRKALSSDLTVADNEEGPRPFDELDGRGLENEQSIAGYLDAEVELKKAILEQLALQESLAKQSIVESEILKSRLTQELNGLTTNLLNSQAQYETTLASLAKLNDLQESQKGKLVELSCSLEASQLRLAELEKAETAWVNEVKLRAAAEDELSFYSLGLSESEISEINELIRFTNHLPRIESAIKKAVYEVYLRDKTKSLIGRVLGGNKVAGIYKITNTSNGRCYVGMSTDVGERWTTHIRRATGVSVPSSNKLYPALIEVGLHKFTFTLIEEVSDGSIRERETYWKKFYASISFGYGIK